MAYCNNCNQVYAKYKIWAVDNPANVSFPLLDAIKKALEKQIYLKANDIKRIVFSYTGESEIRKGKENCHAQIKLNITKNAFLMCNAKQDKDIPRLSIFWIGKTRYEIWREY